MSSCPARPIFTASIHQCDSFEPADQHGEPVESLTSQSVVIAPISVNVNTSYFSISWACSAAENCVNPVCRYAKGRMKR